MRFKHRYVKNLVYDEYFLKWVIDPDVQSDDFWKGWTHNDQTRTKAVSEARMLIIKSIQFPDDSMNDSTQQAMWRVIQKRIATGELATQKKNKNIFSYTLRYAAVIAILILAAIAISEKFFAAEVRESNLTYIEKYAPAGSKLIVHLSDGTIVNLNAESKIRYLPVFEKEKREVFLEGEGFFNVQKDPDRPFIVHSGQLTTTVLGTSFDVRAYPGKNQTNVAVISGQVSVRKTGDTTKVFLQPSHQVTYDIKQDQLIESTFEDQDVAAWKEGVIVFKDACFEDITETLKRWYGVEFIVNKKPEVHEDFNGRFENQPLESVLKGISFSLEFNFVINERTVLIN